MQKSASTPSLFNRSGLKRAANQNETYLHLRSRLVSVKSRFNNEYSRFAVDFNQFSDFEEFNRYVCGMNGIDMDTYESKNSSFHVFYSDIRNQSMLPVTNEHNFARMVNQYVDNHERRLLRIYVVNIDLGSTSVGNAMPTSKYIRFRQNLPIRCLNDLRVVGSLINDNTLPTNCRKVHLHRDDPKMNLGFYIRKGQGLSKESLLSEVSEGIFVSKLLPGALAERCGLLSINDEIIEVNGILIDGMAVSEVADLLSQYKNDVNLIIRSPCCT
ncbi:hypothetical protein ACOME3_003416 [Neoechinorhynchus agilis]